MKGIKDRMFISKGVMGATVPRAMKGIKDRMFPERGGYGGQLSPEQ